MPGFCCLLGLFRAFWGVFRCLSQLSMDEVEAGHCCFGRPGTQGHFLTKIIIRGSIFPYNIKKDSLLFPFSGWLGKTVNLFHSNSINFCFTAGGFNFPGHCVIIQRTTAHLEINISDHSFMTNATYQTGAQ